MIFNEEIYKDDKHSLDFNKSETILRKAVRAIIVNGDKILMVISEKTNEYKFPGGGIEKNETIEEALKREVMEEIGYKVIKIKEKVGIITEYSIAMEDINKIFVMVSEYYKVKIDRNQIEQKLDAYEEKLLFKPNWTNIETAWKTNKRIIDNKLDSTPWIKRETRVLELLMEIKITGKQANCI